MVKKTQLQWLQYNLKWAIYYNHKDLAAALLERINNLKGIDNANNTRS